MPENAYCLHVLPGKASPGNGSFPRVEALNDTNSTEKPNRLERPKRETGDSRRTLKVVVGRRLNYSSSVWFQRRMERESALEFEAEVVQPVQNRQSLESANPVKLLSEEIGNERPVEREDRRGKAPKKWNPAIKVRLGLETTAAETPEGTKKLTSGTTPCGKSAAAPIAAGNSSNLHEKKEKEKSVGGEETARRDAGFPFVSAAVQACGERLSVVLRSSEVLGLVALALVTVKRYAYNICF
nr:hypothetical protein Iba_chr05dCG4010 [Ipomoea batatas]